MSYLCPNCNSFPLEDYIWWVSGRKHTNWWCAICGDKYDWKQPNRPVVVQTGAKDRKEEFYDPAREDISKRSKTRSELWEEHLKDPNSRWTRH